MATIIQKLAELRSDLALRGEVALQRPLIFKGVRCLACFVLALILSRAEVFGDYTPFGVSIVAVAGAGFTGFLAFCGVVLGSYFGGDFVWGLKYSSMAVLVFAASFVFQDLKSYHKNWFMPAVAAFMAACTGFIYAQDLGWSIEATVFFITETVLIGGGAYFFKIALTDWSDGEPNQDTGLRQSVSVLILIGACLITLAQFTPLAGMSVGRVMALFLVMCTAYRGGVGAGSAAGAALGIAMDAGAGGIPFFSMAYALSGLLSGIFGRHGKLLFTISFVLTHAVAILWTWNTAMPVTAALYEMFVVSMVFMMMPGSVIGKFALDFGEPTGEYGALRIRAYARERMDRLSGAFLALYETVRIPAPRRTNDNDVASVFDRAAEVTCRKCAQATVCWRVEYESTVEVMNNVTAPMLKRGQLYAVDFPEHFRTRCQNLQRYVDSVNEELRALTYRKQFLSRLREARGAIYAQYEDMSSILAGLSKELDADLTQEPFREQKLRRYLRALDMEAQTAVFRDRNGRLHLEIKSPNLRLLTKGQDSLEKLSAVMGVRLCEKPGREGSRQIIAAMEAEPLAAAVGIASVRRRGQVVSGDRGTYFKTDEGCLYVILSDGMGTGFNAAKESGEVLHILEQFLKAGLEPEIAMKLLHTALQAKHEQVTGCATVDLMCLNLFSGETKLFKYGAMPTYVKRGRTVRSIRGESLAAGLKTGEDTPAPDILSLRLEPGSFAAISSDGLLMEEDDTWFRTIMADYTGTDAKELARLILEAAIDRSGCQDDMTVLIVFLEERA